MPVAVITVDKETIFWGETVNMNSTGSYDPDGTIVSYEWKIVQDDVVIPGATASYAFTKSYNNVRIRLTAIDDKGGRGIAEKIIKVNALYTAPSTVTKKKIQTLLYNKEATSSSGPPIPRTRKRATPSSSTRSRARPSTARSGWSSPRWAPTAVPSPT